MKQLQNAQFYMSEMKATLYPILVWQTSFVIVQKIMRLLIIEGIMTHQEMSLRLRMFSAGTELSYIC